MLALLVPLAWWLFLISLFLTTGIASMSLRRQSVGAWRPSADRLLLAFGIGTGLWVIVLFFLASTGLLRPPWLRWAAFAGMIVSCLTVATTLAAQKKKREHELREGNGSGPSTRLERAVTGLLLAGLAAVALPLMLQALRPDVSWDANVYHLTLPRLFLEHGGFYSVPLSVYAQWPLNTELLYSLALSLDNHTLAKLLHCAFGLLTALLAYRLAVLSCRSDPQLMPRSIGLVAAVLFLANPVVLYEIRIAYVDLASAFFLCLSLLVLARSLEPEAPLRTGALLLCGGFLGVVAGIKLNGFFAGLSVALALLLTRRRERLKAAALVGVPALLLLLPWLIKSFLLTGNPIYPLFYNLFGGPDWSLELASRHADWQRSIGMGRSLVDYLLLPVRVILFGDFGYDHFDGRLSPIWLIALPVALWRLNRDRLRQQWLLVTVVYFVLWAMTSQQIRFLIPILPLGAAATARGLHQLTCDARQKGWHRVNVGAIQVTFLVVAMSGLLRESWVYIRQAPRLFADLKTHGSTLETAVVRPVYRFINDQLPSQSCLLLVNTNHGFYIQRPFLADSFFEASQVEALLAPARKPDEVLARLGGKGITHLLLENVDRGLELPAAFFQVLSDRRLTTPLYQSPERRFSVFELEKPRHDTPCGGSPPAGVDSEASQP